MGWDACRQTWNGIPVEALMDSDAWRKYLSHGNNLGQAQQNVMYNQQQQRSLELQQALASQLMQQQLGPLTQGLLQTPQLMAPPHPFTSAAPIGYGSGHDLPRRLPGHETALAWLDRRVAEVCVKL